MIVQGMNGNNYMCQVCHGGSGIYLRPISVYLIKILWQRRRLGIGGRLAGGRLPTEAAVAVTVIVSVVASDGGINAGANDTNSAVDRPFENTASLVGRTGGSAEAAFGEFFRRGITRRERYDARVTCRVFTSHSSSVFFSPLQMEIAKRLNGIIAQLLPFLSQEV